MRRGGVLFEGKITDWFFNFKSARALIRKDMIRKNAYFNPQLGNGASEGANDRLRGRANRDIALKIIQATEVSLISHFNKKLMQKAGIRGDRKKNSSCFSCLLAVLFSFICLEMA